MMQDVEKRLAGIRAADMVEDGSIVGLGTGSTVFHAFGRLSERIGEGLEITGIPTSFQAAARARAAGIRLATLDDHPEVSITIDGADQVDCERRLIKGRGGALTREKCIAAASKRILIVVDPTKTVEQLEGMVPLEVIPFGLGPVVLRISEMGAYPLVREGSGKDGPVITDNGNMIVDAHFGRIEDPVCLEETLEKIAGVLACGLFTGFTGETTIIVGEKEGARVIAP
jgi:ribose 5-phosphate isomerase A